ncbi:MAG: ribose-phosphate pyrophosphokinase [SAR202 cluster bacterium]|nr:ribose-phosphate pyrophosphokinase [SAR202 cluster bacterium]|tara:strand:- start:4997 stop:5947 length:951 start_codon:yes stop_codon:yes gene_type:complete
MSLFDEIKVFSGNSHPQLARDICKYLKIPLGESEVFKFSNDETFVRIRENVREKDVFLVQPISSPVNDNLMELFIMIDAAKRASAGRITVVIPYYAYGRTDKKDQPRVAITARLIADFIITAGADRVLTMNLHAGQIQGFFNIPLDELTSIPLLAKQYQDRDIKNLVVVATDVGAAKRAHDLADILNTPMAIIEKQRYGNEDTVEAVNLIGDVKGKCALIVDDEIGTGGTVIAASKILTKFGVNKIYCCAVHPVLSGNAADLLAQSDIEEIIVTDTLPIPPSKMISNLKVVSVSDMLGEAITRIHSGLSVGAMFGH